MATFLFSSTVFGPVFSRRLGMSLGINLLPNTKKVCNYNCIYCECGLSGDYSLGNEKLPSRNQVKKYLEERLKKAAETGEKIDTITFAGNGEPTLHPHFHEIIDDVLELRLKLYPEAKIAVLSNATLINNNQIFESLQKADMNILKLDSLVEQTQRLMNCPAANFSLNNLIEGLKLFRGSLIIQTMFIRGTYNGVKIDNTTGDELNLWLDALMKIQPQSVMIYTIARDTPVTGLEKISQTLLEDIARLVREKGIETIVSC
ncbi:MAG: radical SAM protein [Bacteroidales bacterium]